MTELAPGSLGRDNHQIMALAAQARPRARAELSPSPKGADSDSAELKKRRNVAKLLCFRHLLRIFSDICIFFG